MVPRGLQGLLITCVLLVSCNGNEVAEPIERAPAASAPQAAGHEARVTHISDGDTAYFEPLDFGTSAASWPGRKARFIGIDTPEISESPPECFGPEATAFTSEALSGRTVRITYGTDPIDPYDRALVYIWLGDQLFNLTLVREGYARVDIYEPNEEYEEELRAAERAARKEKLGRWGQCSR